MVYMPLWKYAISHILIILYLVDPCLKTHNKCKRKIRFHEYHLNN